MLLDVRFIIKTRDCLEPAYGALGTALGATFHALKAYVLASSETLHHARPMKNRVVNIEILRPNPGLSAEV